DQRLPLEGTASGIGFPPDHPGVSQCGERGSDVLPAFNNNPFLGDLSDGISKIPFGLPKYVNDEHNWSARGTLLFHPPDSELNVYLNGHGSRLDQDSVLGQAIGTQPLPGATDTTIRFGRSQGLAGY